MQRLRGDGTEPVPSLYADPLVYDVLFEPGTVAEVDALERIARDRVRTPRGKSPVWLEPACGSGRYLRALARRGQRVIGFDRSPAMVAYARRRAAAVWRGTRADAPRIFVADMTSFDLGRVRVDFAFNPFNTIRHLETDAAMRAHFAAIARALRRGGIYAVGLSTTVYGREPMDEDVWEGRRGALRVHQTVQYVPPGSLEPLPRAGRQRRVERVITHLRIQRAGKPVEHRDGTYDLRCYSDSQWRRLVATSHLLEVGTVDATGDATDPSVSSYTIRLLTPR